MTRKRRKTRSRQQREAIRRRGWLGSSLARLGRLENQLTMDLLLYGSSFVRVFSDGSSARVAPLTDEEFHETAQALRLLKDGPHWTDNLPSVTRAWDDSAGAWVTLPETEHGYTGATITGKWWFEK